MTTLPVPGDAARLADFLPRHPRRWVFWDKKHGVCRAAEDDRDSALYTESRDLDTVLGYKIRIATGKRAREIDARQARAIMEVLEWQRQQQTPQ